MQFSEEAISTRASFWVVIHFFTDFWLLNCSHRCSQKFFLIEEEFWLIYWGMKNEHKLWFLPNQTWVFSFSLQTLWRMNFSNYFASDCGRADPETELSRGLLGERCSRESRPLNVYDTPALNPLPSAHAGIVFREKKSPATGKGKRVEGERERNEGAMNKKKHWCQ